MARNSLVLFSAMVAICRVCRDFWFNISKRVLYCDVDGAKESLSERQSCYDLNGFNKEKKMFFPVVTARLHEKLGDEEQEEKISLRKMTSKIEKVSLVY